LLTRLSRMQKRTRQKNSSFWLVTAFIAGIFVLLMGVSFGQELRRRIVLQQHVSELKRDIKDHEQKIADLKKLIEYLKTDSYIERAAHEKLGYQKVGEQVVVVPDGGKVASAESIAAQGKKEPVPIPKQWWNLFFGTEKQ